MGEVLDFRKGATEQAGSGVPGTGTAHPPVTPTDGLVLACTCGSTLMELRNAGVVCCYRCGSSGKVYWAWMKPTS